MNKILRNILKVIFGLFIFINVVLAFHAWKFTHFYSDPELRNPAKTGFLHTLKFILVGEKMAKSVDDSIPIRQHTNLTLQSTENLKLAAWSMSAPAIQADSAGVKPPPTKGTVILCHGHGETKADQLPAASYFLSLGYNVFLFDFRAHGNSQGEQCLVGIKECADVKAAYDYVKASGEKNITLFGVSMGAAAITKAINDYALQPQKIILEMPFATMLDATKGKLNIMGLPKQLAPLLGFWGGTLNGAWVFANRPYIFAEKIKCPVLLQWGAKDKRVTEAETNEIFSHLGAQKKTLVVYESAEHEHLCLKEPQKWRANITSFMAL